MRTISARITETAWAWLLIGGLGSGVGAVLSSIAAEPTVGADGAADHERVGSELLALYDFTSAGGAIVQDRSGLAEPLDLRIADPKSVRQSDGALEIVGKTLIRTDKPATRLIEAVRQSGAITIEAWVRTANVGQSGPARMVTLSRNPNERNFTLGQDGDKFEVRLRTTKTRLIESAFDAAPPADALGGMIAADVATLLPDDFLVKVDRASMAHGLEVRPPLLDHEMIELAARIPSRFKVRRGETKWILKETYRAQLPAAAIDRPKQGFEIPIDSWLRGPLRDMFESAVLAPDAAVRSLIDQDTARRLYRTHLSGLGRHGNTLWSLLVLSRWADRYLSARTETVCHAASLVS